MASAKKWHFSIDKETLEVVESTVISDDDLFLECKYCLKMIVVLQVWFWHPFSQSPCLVMQHSCFVVLVSWHCMHRLRKIQFVTLTACFSVQSIHGGGAVMHSTPSVVTRRNSVLEGIPNTGLPTVIMPRNHCALHRAAYII